jgi:hypothetical protein
VVQGNVLTVTALAAPGYLFTGWTFDANVSYDPADVNSATTTVELLGSTTLAASFTPCTLTVTAWTSTTWVYQNTPVTTEYRHVITLAVSATDTWGNDAYTAAVSQTGSGLVRPSTTFVDLNGNGSVTDTTSFAFTSTSGTLYLVGSTRTDGVSNTGSCTVTVSVSGDVGGTATASVTIMVRQLGDILGNQSIGVADRTALNAGIAESSEDPVYDLLGNQSLGVADRTLLNTIIANGTVD